jgi:glycosyltransferase involved in cell wall biosynthesis
MSYPLSPRTLPGGVHASIIIPARNAAATLPATLAALAAQDDPPRHEVIVVDDGSTDGTQALAQDAATAVRLLATAGGVGPGAARNIGAAAAQAPLLVFTDADCEPEPDWLARIVRAARQADLVQGKVLPPPGVPVGPFDRFVAVVSEYGLYQTANLAIARDLFERAGRFRPIVRPKRSKELGEDAWLAWRARRLGARVLFEPGAVVRHAVFRRGPLGYVGEQARVTWFPELVRHMPELREAFLYRRWFLAERTAHFDLAIAGAAAALATRRALPLAAALPYARTLEAQSRGWGRRRQPEVAAAQVAADFVRLGALTWGSVRSRSAVL